MGEEMLPKFDYYLDESDPDMVILRRQDGSFVGAFSAVVVIALHDPSVQPSSGPPSSCGTAGCTTGSPRPLGAHLLRGMVLRLCRS